MKTIFYILILCVAVHSLSFMYISGRAIETEMVEMEDFAEETDRSEEGLEDGKEHCPFWDPFSRNNLFLPSLFFSARPTTFFISSCILTVEGPPPRM
ncbi:MAG: hypothetical protein ACHQF2_02505 [Flavobacteriales bacterium]